MFSTFFAAKAAEVTLYATLTAVPLAAAHFKGKQMANQGKDPAKEAEALPVGRSVGCFALSAFHQANHRQLKKKLQAQKAATEEHKNTPQNR